MLDYSFYEKIQNIWELYKLNFLSKEELFNLFEENFSNIPYIDQLETTNFCNMRCKMCPRYKYMTRKIKIMDMSLFKKIIDELNYIEIEKRKKWINPNIFLPKNNDLTWDWSKFDIFDLRLHYFWAPFLDPYLIDRVRYIKEKSLFWVQLSESINNITISKAEELFKLGLNRLIIALDWLNWKEFEDNRWIAIDYNKEIEKIKEIISVKLENSYKTHIDIQVINLKSIDTQKFINYWIWIDWVNILLKDFFPYPGINTDLWKIDISSFSKECSFPYTSLAILANWKVVSCCADYNWENILWDLNKENLYDIWHSNKYKDFRKNFIYNTFDSNSLCKRCWYYPFNNKE